MDNPREAEPKDDWRELSEQVKAKEVRKLKARRERLRLIWFGFGMFGLIGWAIVIPTLIGIAVGMWIDRRWPSDVSWTLMLLFVGVVLGCLNAWNWIRKETRPREKETSDDL